MVAAAKKKKRKNLIQATLDHIKEGDRVIWILVVVLMMISLVAIFSSTSQSAISSGQNLSKFVAQLLFVVLGFLTMLICSAIPNIKILRWLSQWGFIVSTILLIFLNLRLRIGSVVYVPRINGVSRAIYMFGFGLQVYEVTKVYMVMYLAWAVQKYENGKFGGTMKLGRKWPKVFGWTLNPVAQRWIYIFGPIFIITGLVMIGSNSSAIICLFIMFVTIMVAGMKIKHLILPVIAVLGALFLATTLHIVSNGHILERMETLFSRLKVEVPYPDTAVRQRHSEKIALVKADPKTFKIGSAEFYEYLDKIRQPAGAELAIVQGGRRIVGKGPGRSTQKYSVPVMHEDYMFSFIVEEYGIFAGLAIILIYMGFFARCYIIVRNSSNRYARAAVAGLGTLITFQAFFHIVINCNIGLLSGQTLPFISYGRCSLLCFSFAAGVILCISTLANKNIRKEQEDLEKLMSGDDIQTSMTIVESIDDLIEESEIEQDNSHESNN